MASVIIYTKNNCPFCVAAKSLLERRQVPFDEVNIQRWSIEEVEKLAERSGMRTVPQIFFGDEVIGGCDELVAKDQQEGSLDSLKSAA
ncbi:MAG: glutaredoxin [Elusimicrobia bacterium]|nr:MAG: glutaredoxin [Elusimicrobiota bacterium]